MTFYELLDGDGRIRGADATKFFAMSDLSRQELKQVSSMSFYIHDINSNKKVN